MFGWNFFLTNAIRRELGCFESVYMSWRVLGVKAETGGTNE